MKSLLILFITLFSFLFTKMQNIEQEIKIKDCRETGENNIELSIHKDRDIVINRIKNHQTKYNDGTIVPESETGYNIHAYRIYKNKLKSYGSGYDTDSLYEMATYIWKHDTISIDLINSISKTKHNISMRCDIQDNNVIIK